MKKLSIIFAFILIIVFAGNVSAGDEQWEGEPRWDVVDLDAQPLKTGQTTSYGVGDDGELEKGISRSYGILTTGQHYSGTSKFSMPAGTDDLISKNCVIGKNSGLMWLRTPSDGLGPAANGLIPWDTDAAGSGVTEFVTQANLGFAGYTDWRMPNVNELKTLTDYSQSAPAVDSTAFPAIPAGNIWTSTTYAGDTKKAMLVVHGDSGRETYALKTGTAYILLVRDAN